MKIIKHDSQWHCPCTDWDYDWSKIINGRRVQTCDGYVIIDRSKSSMKELEELVILKYDKVFFLTEFGNGDPMKKYMCPKYKTYPHRIVKGEEI
jgi:hypothetical protein